MSHWTVRDMVNAGTLCRVRLPVGSARDCRRLLFDRRDLDALVERCKEREA